MNEEEINPKFSPEQQKVIEVFTKHIKDAELNESLYHYTRLDGFIGIFESRQFWATDSNYLNDAEELKFGERMLLHEVNVNLAHRKISEAERKTAQIIIESTMEGLASSNQRTYVVSFCTRGDLLSQWRGYGADSGVSIGFKKSFFESIKKENESSNSPLIWNLNKVIYGEEARQLACDLASIIVDDLIASTEGFSTYLGSDGYKMEIVPSPISLRASVKGFCSRVKHEGFSEEQEWRLVGREIAIPQVKFRTRGADLTPYVELSFQRDFADISDELNSEQLEIDDCNGFIPTKTKGLKYIDSIFIGPNSNFEKQKNAVQELLRELYNGNELRQSVSVSEKNVIVNDIANQSGSSVELLFQYRADYYFEQPNIRFSSIPLI